MHCSLREIASIKKTLLAGWTDGRTLISSNEHSLYLIRRPPPPPPPQPPFNVFKDLNKADCWSTGGESKHKRF